MSKRQLMLLGVLSVVAGACATPLGDCDDDSDCGVGGVCDESCDCCLYPAPQGGPFDAGDVQPGQCDPGCAEHDQCAGTSCEARYASILVQTPTSGVRLKQDQLVLVSAKLVLAPGKTANPPDALALTVTPPGQAAFEVPLKPTSDTFTGSFTATLGGVYQLVVTYPDANLTSPPTEVVSDGTAPNFTVTIAPPPGRQASAGGTTWTDVLDPAYAAAYRLDETATVYVSSEDDDVKEDSVAVEVKIGSGGASKWSVQTAPVQSCSSSAKWCGRADVELWKLQMNAFHAELEVTATGSDLVGNTGSRPLAREKVTRFKWVHEADGSPLRGTVSVAGDGRVIGGTTNGGSKGKVFALSADGEPQWEQAIGSIVASPAIGDGDGSTQAVYVAGKDATGPGLWALDLASGAPLMGSICRIAGGSSIEASIVVSKTRYDAETTPIETASTVVNGVGRLLSVRPGSTVDVCLPKAGAGNVSYPDAIVAKGDAIYFADTSGALRGYDFHSVDVWSPRFTPIPGNHGAHGLAVDGSNLVASRASGVFVTSTSGTAGWTHATSAAGGAGVIGAQSKFYAGLGDNTLLAVTVGDSASARLAPFNMSGTVQAAPLLGEGGWVYAAGTDGTLVARRDSDFDANVWSVGGLGAIEASLNIDCSRNATGQKRTGAPGVLYVANTAGKLYALIVDSRGIDTTAPWPKYQHDPRNTGNADTALTEFACD